MAEEASGARLARYYDLDIGEDQPDVDLYLALAAAAGGPILELAAGSGRIALPVAQAGQRVTGVDRDRDMLARADAAWQATPIEVRRGSLQLIEGDITDLGLDERFELVILALNTLLMLPGREAQLAALRTIARHLAPKGRGVVDIWLPSPDDLAVYDGRLAVDWMRRDPADGALVCKLSSARYEPATATARLQTFFDSWPADGGPLRRLAREDAFAFLTAGELLTLVEMAGMRPAILGGDYSMGSFGPGSERLIVVCGLL